MLSKKTIADIKRETGVYCICPMCFIHRWLIRYFEGDEQVVLKKKLPDTAIEALRSAKGIPAKLQAADKYIEEFKRDYA